MVTQVTQALTDADGYDCPRNHKPKLTQRYSGGSKIQKHYALHVPTILVLHALYTSQSSGAISPLGRIHGHPNLCRTREVEKTRQYRGGTMSLACKQEKRLQVILIKKPRHQYSQNYYSKHKTNHLHRLSSRF